MRTRLGVAATAVVALCAVLWAIGWMLPITHTARCETRIAQPPERLFTTITDYAAHPTWRDDLERVEVVDGTPGREVIREHGAGGVLEVRVEQVEAPRVLMTRVTDPEGAFGGTWTIDLTPVQGATRVVITERGDIYSPIFRLASRTVFSVTSTMEAYEKALGRRYSQDAFVTCSTP